MVFSSLPAYLDPANWQQQHQNHQTGGSSGAIHNNPQPSLPLPPPPPPLPHGGSIRPGSMAERARLANIPMPEPALKCPRCESTNTKFCYFNNYSLSQPRHFCKTCRRYWTRGGAIRNVPVGGGCRRNNKRSKGSSSSSSSKSPASSSGGQSTSSGLLNPQIPPLRFMAPLSHHLTDYSAAAADIELNYSGISALSAVPTAGEMNFHIGSNLLGGGGGVSSMLSSAGIEHWQLQQPPPAQFPFLGGLESSASPGMLFPFQGYGGESSHHQFRPNKMMTQGSMLSQLASVKLEDSNNNQGHVNLLMGIPPPAATNDQWTNGGTSWTDVSSFSTSSTSNPL